MPTSTCPVCHGPVSPADDICDNCGAVLSTVSLPPVGASRPRLQRALLPAINRMSKLPAASCSR